MPNKKSIRILKIFLLILLGRIIDSKKFKINLEITIERNKYMHKKQLPQKQINSQRENININNKEVILSMQTETMKSQIEKIARLHHISLNISNLNF